MPKTILIGVGNRFRRDDGVGIYIADTLRDKASEISEDISVSESCGEGAGLMSSWEGYEHVYLFDAIMGRDKVGKIHRLQADEQHIPSDFFKYSSHAFSLAESVELARTLDKMPDQLVIYGVEAKDYGYGDQLTPEVQAAADKVVNSVIEELTSGA